MNPSFRAMGLAAAALVTFGLLTPALAQPARPAPLAAPDKYKALEHRRRQAQIAARKELGLF